MVTAVGTVPVQMEEEVDGGGDEMERQSAMHSEDSMSRG
jgi:hypothetical protein